MPERDFELYLSLLGRFLRLNPTQRDGIADELRDHLEARLEELAARGVPREQAIRKALEEFGDAAELAQHFTRAIHTRRRRLIMRCTMGTVAALAASVLVALAFWPSSAPVGVPNRAVAQLPLGGLGGAGGGSSVGVPGMAAGMAAAPVSDDEERDKELQAKLDNRLEINFVELPLEDVFNYLREAGQIDILLDRTELADEGVALDVPMTLQLNGYKLRTLLELILEPLELGYTSREGLIYVTSAKQANEIRVYNVRDLVAAPADAAAGGMAGMGSAGMMPGAMPGMGMGMPGSSMGGPIAPVGGLGGMYGGPGAAGSQAPTSLASVISRTIAPGTWEESGGVGSIIEYNGLLVVKNRAAVHGRVRQLLDIMRKSLHAEAGTTTRGIPDVKRTHTPRPQPKETSAPGGAY